MKKYIQLLFQLVLIGGLLLLPPMATQAQTEMDSLSNLFYPDGLNDVWGYADEAGNEYALIGVKTGVSIVDVTNATQPKELFFIKGMSSTWRDLKAFGNHAYVVTEADMGMQIIDLQNLPLSIDTTIYHADSSLASVHNIYIDDRGVAYLSGYNDFEGSVPTAERGVKILDLKPNPMKPVFLNNFVHQYSHDVYVRGNILLSSEVYEGNLTIADISNPLEPVVLASQETPNTFTHNAWLSDDGKVVFTTDERNGAFVAAYDISDLSDIRELDRYQSSPGENVMPHNVHVLNDFLIISYYNDGVIVVDANEPDALVETEYFDTSLHSGSGSKGCWGAYPFLPSGNILATDREQGLFIVRPTYKRAAYIDGIVRDQETGEAISDVEVTIEEVEAVDKSDFGGYFKMGVAKEGTYAVNFYKYGYESLIVEGVNLETAEITTFLAEMKKRPSFEVTVEVVDKATGESIEDVVVVLRIPEITYREMSDASGKVVIDPFYNDYYFFLAYKWGWTTSVRDLTINESNSVLRLELERAYFDDFWLNHEWEVDALGDMTGVWSRSAPSASFLEDGKVCNPNGDFTGDFGAACFVTGANGGELEENDLDGGTTILTSPIMDLTDFEFPVLSFQQWFCSSDLVANESDFVKFELSNGIETVELQTVFGDYNMQNVWHEVSFNVLEYIEATNNMHFVVTAQAGTPNVAVEAAIDVFRILDKGTNTSIEDLGENISGNLHIFPNPFDNQIEISLLSPPISEQAVLQVFDSLGRLVWETAERLEQGEPILWGKDMEAGLYFVKFENEVRKVVKF